VDAFDLNVSLQILIWNSLIQGFAVGTIWVPLSVVAFDTLAPSDRAEAAAVFHLLRNIGSSFFISLSIAEIVRATGANYSRMTEMISPYNTTLSLPWVTGSWRVDDAQGLARISKEIGRQAAMIGYLNAFMMYTAASALAVALVLIVRRRASAVG
jgi:MFS transporter, DHA2 family, multidrug resistance protein